VAFVRAEAEFGAADIWVRDLEYGRDFRLTAGSGAYGYPQWAPEGERLTFICQPKGAQDICLKSLKDDAPVALVHESDSWSTTGSWLPDGSGFLIAEQDPVTNDDIYVKLLDGQQAARPVVRSPAYDQVAELSRDGRWLAYLSDEIGSPQVYVRPMSGGAEVWQVSSGGARQVRWRADARELYYIAPDGTVMVVPIQLEPVFRPGEPRVLFSVSGFPDELLPLFEDVSPDGRRFLLNLPAESRSHVGFDVVLNWTSLLETRKD
jgi:Tol biopolymer transport system component